MKPTIDIATLFDGMMETVLSESIIGRARQKGILDIRTHYIRAYTKDKYGRVDDTLYGGGKGMLMQPEPIYACYEAVCAMRGAKPHVIYMSPGGRVLTQQIAREMLNYDHLFILCGHYEGVDQRLLDEIVDEEISIGDYVLTGGELPALVFVDVVSRMVEGVLSDDSCFLDESHMNGVLEHPQYTHPAQWHGRKVPDVLLTGHHAKIAEFRRKTSLLRTLKNRPDLLKNAPLTEEEQAFLKHAKEDPMGMLNKILENQ